MNDGVLDFLSPPFRMLSDDQNQLHLSWANNMVPLLSGCVCYLHKHLRSGPRTAGRHTHSSCRVHVYLLVGDKCTGHINTALKHTKTHWDMTVTPNSNWLLLSQCFNQDLVWMYESCMSRRFTSTSTPQGQVKRS